MATSDPTADIPTKVIDGRVCTTRAGIAKLAGWPAGNTVNARAAADEEFPQPINGPAAPGRVGWYPIDGPTGVTAYLAVLAARDAAKKPPPVGPGDPTEMLYGADAAAALHITPATLRSYARYSRPYWRGERTDKTPLLPHPDDGDADTPIGQCGWLRGTLTEHQAQRPGVGAGAGRPRKN